MAGWELLQFGPYAIEWQSRPLLETDGKVGFLKGEYAKPFLIPIAFFFKK